MSTTLTHAPDELKGQDLLIELLAEELPPKALKTLGQAFAKGVFDGLVNAGLTQKGASFEGFATPRRLAVRVHGVLPQASAKALEQKLMPLSVGLDANANATAALTKKLAALGLAHLQVSDLAQIDDGKQINLWAKTTHAGVSLAEGAQKALSDSLSALPIPKLMSYQLHRDCALPGWSSVHFVRPVHGLLALYGPDVLALTALGLKASRETQGHRFEALSPRLSLQTPAEYETVLLDVGRVVASFEARRESIRQQLATAAKAIDASLTVLEDEALLDEVCALVEHPNVLACQFEAEFLSVPQECLILTMKANQKYFPLLDISGKLSNHFLVVSNISPADASAVIQGNERVVRPRLADAQFFFTQDQKKTLLSRLDALGQVVYHQKLGTQAERSVRVVALSDLIAKDLLTDGAINTEQHTWVKEAARVAKVDLLTDMVGEFPELQGIMGHYYALHDGYAKSVAQAIEDHYKPRFAGDTLPRDVVGQILALADKLEVLVGLFGIGQQPTGDKDPYALRRQALGVIRLLTTGGLTLSLSRLLQHAQSVFDASALQLTWGESMAQLQAFIGERLSGVFKDAGFSSAQIEAVLSLSFDRLDDVDKRLEAVKQFALMPEASALAAANKRIGNILKKSSLSQDVSVNAALFQEDAERALFDAMAVSLPESKALFERALYAPSLASLAALKVPVDHFFEHVMVNAPQSDLRENRMALLRELFTAMNRVADLSRLA